MSHAVVILAAGRGQRMHSELPKLLHTIGGTTLIDHLLSTVSQINPSKVVVVYGYQGEQLKNSVTEQAGLAWVNQGEQLGTGHATLQGLSAVGETERVLILYGDIPLINADTLKRLLQETPIREVGFVTIQVPNPKGLGRIVRDKTGQVKRIVEDKDATSDEKQIKEINAGFFVVPKSYLEKWLPKLTIGNNQKEYYLSDIITLASSEGIAITTVSPHFEWEILGVNDKMQLAQLERYYQKEKANQLMQQQGLTLLDPTRFDIRGELTVGKDVVIDINVILEGKVIIGNKVTIGPNVYIKNSIIQDGVNILANSVIEGATIGKACVIGPFARVRSGTVLAEKVKIGNFVEVKNTTIGRESKINHLSYIGDASIGQEVNIGAGTITCNYDGKKKHKTIIRDRVLIGSDTQLIAPVTIGEDVTIGAGTTVVRDIPAKHLVHNRVEYRSVPDWSIDKELE